MRILYAIHPPQKKGDKATFRRVGVAFNPNRDGSENVALDMFPGTTFQLRPVREGEE